MANQTSKNIRVGLFVLIGTAFLIFALYLIGAKQNLFGSTFRLKTQFKTVNGLMPGNNVRFTGIDVGTVESVEIINDTTVNVVMVIENKVKEFIKKNAKAAVGTDGLMGNKLVNISASNEVAPGVEDGDQLESVKALSTDEMLKTLSITNENIKDITTDLKTIASKLNSPNSVWNILMDTVVAENVKEAIVNIKITGARTALVAGDLSKIVGDIRAGKGSVGALITDPSIANGLKESIVNIQVLTDSLALVSGDLHTISSTVKSGKGAMGTIIMDTAFASQLNSSMKNINSASKGLDEDLEALKHNILLRKYFKNKAKEEKKK